VQNYLKHLVSALIVLGVSGVAQARDNDDDRKPCSDATLNGLYVFTVSGFNILGGVAQPKAIVELIRFNGDGSLTVPASAVSINGVITRSPPDGPGSYEVEQIARVRSCLVRRDPPLRGPPMTCSSDSKVLR
jgi:hypothetical protein